VSVAEVFAKLVDLRGEVVALFCVVAGPGVVGFKVNLVGDPFFFKGTKVGLYPIQFPDFLSINGVRSLIRLFNKNSILG
jgi:hypothetical protein